MLRLLTKALDAAFAALVGLAVAAVVGELPAETVVVWMALAVGLFLVRSRRDTSHSLVSAGIKKNLFRPPITFI